MTPNNDARWIGAHIHLGNILSNLLWSMLKKSRTPTQHARQVMESAATYADAITALSSTSIVNAAYYIVGGMKKDEAAVITRERRDAVDIWTIPTEGDFFLLQTNYVSERTVGSVLVRTVGSVHD